MVDRKQKTEKLFTVVTVYTIKMADFLCYRSLSPHREIPRKQSPNNEKWVEKEAPPESKKRKDDPENILTRTGYWLLYVCMYLLLYRRSIYSTCQTSHDASSNYRQDKVRYTCTCNNN